MEGALEILIFALCQENLFVLLLKRAARNGIMRVI